MAFSVNKHYEYITFSTGKTKKLCLAFPAFDFFHGFLNFITFRKSNVENFNSTDVRTFFFRAMREKKIQGPNASPKPLFFYYLALRQNNTVSQNMSSCSIEKLKYSQFAGLSYMLPSLFYLTDIFSAFLDI